MLVITGERIASDTEELDQSEFACSPVVHERGGIAFGQCLFGEDGIRPREIGDAGPLQVPLRILERVSVFVRHDDSLREIPICMITSRTGEKHRERALAIGVNEYLGKPFQETELLETIERLTGRQ